VLIFFSGADSHRTTGKTPVRQLDRSEYVSVLDIKELLILLVINYISLLCLRMCLCFMDTCRSIYE
jgi:hypothetical protein